MDKNKDIKITCNQDIAAQSVAELKNQLVAGFEPAEIVGFLSNGLYEKRESAPDKTLSQADKRRWQELVDLMWHMDDQKSDDDDSFPQTDPQSLISRQIKEGLVSKEEGRKLKEQFNKEVHKAIGQDLSAQQVKKLFKVFRNFNPTSPS